MMFHRLYLLFGGYSALMLFANQAYAANILYLNGVSSPSHSHWNTAFANGLAAHGHNITILTPDIDKKPPKNVHYIYLNGLYNELYEEIVKSFFDQPHPANTFGATIEFTDYMTVTCEEMLKSDGFQTLLSYPNDFRFDLIIFDMTQGDCLLGFMHKFNYPPLMAVTAFSQPPYLSSYVGGHHYYAYSPHYNFLFGKNMNFYQRFSNFIAHIIELINWEYSFVKNVDKLVEGKFGPGMPPVSELEKRTAIALVSTHPIFDYTRPQLENVIPVGGLHIKDAKPIPKDLENFIESAKKGAVLFALGSNVKASVMSYEKRKALLDAFQQLPDYHFIWKYEDEMTDLKLPKNVMIRPWLPQSDILAHPKIKAFFTHGGLLGTFEALWRGVPVIGIPFGFDQTTNILKCIELGVAEKMDFFTMSTEIIKDRLQKVLENPNYLENARRISARFQDQKEKPLERAVWWAEWLIRNPDCDYLKSPVLRLGFIAGNSYDVIATICFGLFMILFAVIKLSLFFVRVLFSSSSSKDKQIKHKKSD